MRSSRKKIVRYNTPGGIVSPGELRDFVAQAVRKNISYLSISSRQEFYFEYLSRGNGKNVQASTASFLEKGHNTNPNVISNYSVIDIFSHEPWLNRNIYKGIMDTIPADLMIKVSFSCRKQNLVPLISGMVNFVASSLDNYWYLLLKHDKHKRIHHWPYLIDTRHIGGFVKFFNHELPLAGEDTFQIDDIVSKAYETLKVPEITSMDRIQKSSGLLPFYEGLHPMSMGKYWLGISSRENKYKTEFLDSVCALALQGNRVKDVSITPWRSLIIKDIEEDDLLQWNSLLGAYNINTAHASQELNWQVADTDRYGIHLKNKIIRSFISKDVRTEGLTFGINSENADLQTSIVIERKSRWRAMLGLPAFSVRFRKDFDPLSEELYIFADDISEADLPDTLAYLCREYYSKSKNVHSRKVVKKSTTKVKIQPGKYQCTDCLTVYDPEKGDPVLDILPGTSFHQLPETYCCPLCEQPKSNFKEVEDRFLQAV